MRRWLHPITDWVSTKRGMWITITVWLVLMIGMSAGPKLNDYKVSNFQSLPDEAQAIIADQTLEEYFPNDQGMPGILVFHNEKGDIDLAKVQQIVDALIKAKVEGVETIVNPAELPPPVLKGLESKDGSTFILPMNLQAGLGNSVYAEINEQASKIGNDIAKTFEDTKFYITGPAGIAGDTIKLFEQADFVLLLATIVIILVLLIAIYRSPLLAIIPLLATVIVYQVVNQAVAMMGAAGLEINNSTTSIMSILLFAAVTDYSLFVFSRYREELNHYESKYESMKHAMRATGEPVFFAGGTVLAAMLVLFFADFRDYQNFAPIFSMAMFIIIIASITLVPALFTLFGRKAFWPKVPRFGERAEASKSIWGKIAKFVVNKPGVSGGVVALCMIVMALNVGNLQYEFDTVKKFPKDLPSRVGYEIVEKNYNKGDLAPTTVLIVSKNLLTAEQLEKVTNQFLSYKEIESVRLVAKNESGKAAKLSIALTKNPYSSEAIDFVEQLRKDTSNLMKEVDIEANVYYSGVTAKLVDERDVNNGDIVKIVAFETVLILVLLVLLTRSWKMPIYMMATILISFVSALGLGIFLVNELFGYEAISTRVPVYAFIFLVALGIDYNIILASRFIEERRAHKVKDALEISMRNTGGVISSAGVILAATFAALTTMPIADLFIFGFIVAVGIIMDTFFVRGVLLPSLIMFFEKDRVS